MSHRPAPRHMAVSPRVTNSHGHKLPDCLALALAMHSHATPKRSSKEGLSPALLLLVLIDEPEHVRTPVGARQLVELDPRRGRGADGPPRRAWARGSWEVMGRALARRAWVRRARARWANRARSYLCAAQRPAAWPASLAVALAAFPTAADLTER